MHTQTRTLRKVEITHVVLHSTKPFVNVQAFLEAVVPPIDDQISESSPGLVIYLKRDDGSAVQYEIGNALTASTMKRCNIGAALYTPLRVLLHENGDGSSRFEYDLPSSLVAQFDDDRINDIGNQLDDLISHVLSAAAG